MSQLIGLIGPSGAGKSSIVKMLCDDHGFQYIKSYTTRPQRDAEDTDHIFISQEEFNAMNKAGEFFGTIYAFGHSYGMPRFSLYASTVMLLRAPAVKAVLTQFPDARIIEVEASLEVLKKRLEKRGTIERFDPELLEKEMLYGRSVAHITIDSSSKSTQEIVSEILSPQP